MRLITLLYGLIFIMLSTLIISCQDSDSSISSTKNPLEAKIDSLEQLFDNKPDKYVATELITSYIKKVEQYSFDEEKASDFKEIGDYASYIKDYRMAISSYIWALKADPRSDEADDIIYKVANIYDTDSLYQNNAQFLYSLYLSEHPDGKHIKDVKSKYHGKLSAIAYIDSLANTVTKSGAEIRQESIRSYIDAVELYGSVMPDSEASPEYIQKAAMLLQVLNEDKKAVSFYDWILNKFPDSPEAENALFSKAIHYADANKDTTTVRQLYDEYLERYPDGKYVKDIKVLEKRVGKPLFPVDE